MSAAATTTEETRDEVFEEIKASWSNESLTIEEFLAGWKQWIAQNNDTQLQVIINNQEIPVEMRQAAADELRRRWESKPAMGGAGGPSHN